MTSIKKYMKKNSHKIVLLMPGIIMFSLVIVLPFFMGAHLSLTNWNGISKTYDFIWFENYKRALTTTAILKPLGITLLFGVLGSVLNNIVSLSLALLVSRKIKGVNFFKTVFFIPVCMSTVLVSYIWNFIYGEVLTTVFNVANPLGSLTGVVPAIIVMSLWSTIGINMLIYLASIKNVPPELYEAAVVDGAGAFKRFFKITLPMIVPAFTVCLTLTLTSYLKEFALTYTATAGGPADSSTTLAIYIFNNFFSYEKAGYAQAVSILFMLVLIVIGLAVSKVLRKKEVEL